MDAKRKLKTRSFLDSHPVFSLDEAIATLTPKGNRGAMVERLKHHLEERTVVRVAREIYATVPAGMSPEHFEPDPFLVARAARPDAVFAYHAAFHLLGAAHTLWNEYAVFTANRRTDLELASARIHFLVHPAAFSEQIRLGTQQVEHRGYVLRVTGPERTLVEGFRQLARVGGPEEHVRCAAGLTTLDLPLLAEVLERYSTARLAAAVGWFLERYQATFHVPDQFLEWLETCRPASARYLRREQRGGTLLPRWNLIVPEALLQGEADEG